MLSDGVASTTAGVVRIEVEAATVVPVNTPPSYVLGELSLTVAEDSGSVPTLTVLREVSDVDGDEVTLRCWARVVRAPYSRRCRR